MPPQVRRGEAAGEQHDRRSLGVSGLDHRELARRHAHATLLGRDHPPALAIASATRTARTTSFTSWTRARCAPRETSHTTAPIVPSTRSSSGTSRIVPRNRFARRTDEHRAGAGRAAHRRAASARGCARGPCRTRSPGRSRSARGRSPRARRPRSAGGGTRAPRPRRRRSAAPPASSSARRACASGRRRRRALRTTSNMSGSAPPETSFTIAAPAASASAATLAFRVSIEIGIAGWSSARRSITGRTRSSSSSTETAVEPGRVDSPPTSRMSAPSSTIRVACATAAARSRNRPPSEKESGVTLRIPMTRVRSAQSNARSPTRQRRDRPPLHRSRGRWVPMWCGASWRVRGIVAEQSADRRGHGDRARLLHARIVMHRCSASITTNTPRGASAASIVSAISVVRRSCTCGRLARMSHDPRDLRQAGDAPGPCSGCRRRARAAERQQVVLAQALERDVTDHDHLVEVGARDHGRDRRGVDPDALEDLCRYMSATRRGVSTTPARSGSSPIPSGIMRTAASILAAIDPEPSGAHQVVRASPGSFAASRGKLGRAQRVELSRSRLIQTARSPARRDRRDVVEQRGRDVHVPVAISAASARRTAPSGRAPACTSRPRRRDRSRSTGTPIASSERGEERRVGVGQDADPPAARRGARPARPGPRRTAASSAASRRAPCRSSSASSSPSRCATRSSDSARTVGRATPSRAAPPARSRGTRTGGARRRAPGHRSDRVSRIRPSSRSACRSSRASPSVSGHRRREASRGHWAGSCRVAFGCHARRILAGGDRETGAAHRSVALRALGDVGQERARPPRASSVSRSTSIVASSSSLLRLLLQDVERLVVGLVDHPADLVVDLEGDLVRVVGLGLEVPAEEDLVLLLPERLRADRVRACRTRSPSAARPSVARSMSFAAPVVMSPTISSSATRPPISIASSSRQLLAGHEELVLLWAASACSQARGRAGSR